MGFILDMRVVNTDAASYLHKTPKMSLAMAVRDKKCKYLDSFLQQRRHFFPFFNSFDGLLDTEAGATLNRLPSRLATKWCQPYSCA